jgi:rRNA maturation endonuclease Nob1
MTLELDPDESDNDSEDESAHDSAPGSANEERSDEGEAFQQVAPVKANAPAKVQRAPVKELADDEGWITPSNIHKASKSFDPFGDVKVEKKPEIACLTTDFAMQVMRVKISHMVVVCAATMMMHGAIRQRKRTKYRFKLLCPALEYLHVFFFNLC